MTEQHEQARRRWQAPWAALLLVAALALYVGGYFALSRYEASVPASSGLALPASSSTVFPSHRFVDYGWMLTIYEPLRAAESYMRGKKVELTASAQFGSDAPF